MPLDRDLIIIGFDVEWVYIPGTDSNRILSYQYYGKALKGTWSGIIYPIGPNKTDRLKFIKFIALFISIFPE